MPAKNDYSVTRVPSNDWDNIMETVSLDGTYSEEIKNEVWTAIENMEDFSAPWVVIKLRKGKANAKIFGGEKSARRYVESLKKKMPGNEQVFCVKGQYQGSKILD